MLKQKFIIAFACLTALLLGVQTDGFAFGKKVKKQAKFKVRIGNISNADGLTAADGTKYPFAVSPGLFVVTGKKTNLFKAGKKAGAGLEAQAEDGDPAILSKELFTKTGAPLTGVFNTPVGAETPAPILAGDAFEFEFTASEGMKLNFAAMFGQSNDLFYAPETAIDLFVGGKALSGDLTGRILLWDAGTEVNEPLGIGTDQAPRQSAANTGQTENGVVRLVKNVAPANVSALKSAISFAGNRAAFPVTADVLRVTVTAE